tara:strand:- start:2 stop:214 length:213 start_codon:yes stop_codon:yes gene_type:complete
MKDLKQYVEKFGEKASHILVLENDMAKLKTKFTKLTDNHELIQNQKSVTIERVMTVKEAEKMYGRFKLNS